MVFLAVVSKKYPKFAIESYNRAIKTAMAMNVHQLTTTDAALEELKQLDSHVFTNDHFGIVLNGNAVTSHFIREGQIYHVSEPRIIIVLEGSGDISIDLEDYHVEKGTVIMSRGDIILEMKHCPPEVSVVAIVFREEVDIHENIAVNTTPSEFERLLRTIYLAWDEAQLSPFRLETVRHLLLSIVTELQYIHADDERTLTRQPHSRYHELFSQFKQLVSRHCDRERNVPFYADQLHITPHHLSAVIKDASGQSVMWWINRATLQRAKLLLKTSTITASEVADRLNFQTASSFSNFFKRETGMTPMEYRERG